MMQRNKMMDDILKKTGNKIPFQVPENYFENFALEMDSKIGSQQLTVKKLMSPWMYMAAMFVGLLVLGNVLFSVYRDNQKKHTEMYELYVASQLDDSALTEYYYNSMMVSEE
jgi:hypothetical protein